MAAKHTTPLRRSARIAARLTTRKRPHPNTLQPTTTITIRKPPKCHARILGPLATPSHRLSTHSCLLTLPPELRLQIWQHAMTAPTGTPHLSPTSQRFDVSLIGAGLLTACHLTALETQHLPGECNTFVFPGPEAFEMVEGPRGGGCEEGEG
ncbi:hypothetical protein K458DRAFT_383680 [Lentithecium fluviatile CBS 122367]|uniref:Uncharacterized protein n=1 Tax=Lentithecium fluviatile CBS 122367 TaxID=1168545 RepID=A0A6G1JFV1_9PLEO|nr:hypothetical protein K458DRAFT_383680 [Lentithecium fluviatile CBS 122367]